MSKHWRPEQTRWLSPEAYRALSPADRRRLFAARAAAKRRAQNVVSLADYRPATTVWGHVAGLAFTVAGAVCISVLTAAVRTGATELPKWNWSPASAPVRASFGYCYSGGGTNCVVDGDTFYINGDKVRIADIDAPETHPPRCGYEAQLGNQATEKLHALLNSGAVTMTSIDRDRDVYGRLLRNVSVNGADVGEAMVSAGVAREWVGRREPWC
ncbi:MAG: thermonuclease family protein [Bacillota bacterium]